jgi:hypothetical protein
VDAFHQQIDRAENLVVIHHEHTLGKMHL